jgi:hypothetical protein
MTVICACFVLACKFFFCPDYALGKPETKMVNESRQAGDSITPSREAFQESFEAAERLRDDLAQVKKRWDNRLILEKTPLWEGYLNGRFEIILYMDWRIGTRNYNLACRVAVHRAVIGFDDPSRGDSCRQIDIFDGNHRHRGQDKVMLVACCPDWSLRKGHRSHLRTVLSPPG